MLRQTRLGWLILLGLMTLVLSLGVVPAPPDTLQAHLGSSAWLDRGTVALVSPEPVWAQEAAAPAADTKDGQMPLSLVWVPIVATLGTALLKYCWRNIPKGWLPVVCVVLGFVADGLNAWVTGGSMNPVVAAELGAAGIGIREIVDRMKQAAFAPA